MTLIVKNTGVSPFTILGQTIAAAGQYTVPASIERVWLADAGLYYQVFNGNATVNDGFSDYSSSVGTDFITRRLQMLIDPAYTGSYVIPIDVSPVTGGLSNGTYYWSMRNGLTGNRMFIEKIVVMGEFTGIAALSNSKFGFYRFSGATPAGGAVQAATPTDTTFAASNLLDARKANGGLTVTGVTVEANALALISLLNQLIGIPPFNVVDDNPEECDCICLNPGEGLIIGAASAMVAGAAIHGFLQYNERP